MPALSTEVDSDLTGSANGYERVRAILGQYRQELQALVPEGLGTGITRLCCWAPASRTERPDLTRSGDFALCVGVPSGLSPFDPEEPPIGQVALDYAIAVTVSDESQLPRGPLFLEGVPLVVRIIRPGSLVPSGNRAAIASS
jgi:hypothetical protein